MLPREIKKIDGKQFIEYEAFQKMRDMKSKIDGERMELFQENQKLKKENKRLKKIIGNIVYLYKEEPAELGEYVKSGFKCGMSN